MTMDENFSDFLRTINHQEHVFLITIFILSWRLYKLIEIDGLISIFRFVDFIEDIYGNCPWTLSYDYSTRLHAALS